MAVILRGRYSDLFFSRLPMIHEIIFEAYDGPAPTYQELFNVNDSQRAFEETTQITGFGEFPSLPEGEGVTYDTLFQGFDKRYTHTKFGKGFQISLEAMDDDLDGAISRAAPALGRASRHTAEKSIWAIINNSFTSETTPDGSFIFAANHALAGPEGGTFDNTVVGDLAVATLESAINKFNDMVDDRGLLIDVAPSVLVYNDALQWTVAELLQSQLRPDNANNAINPLNRLGYKTV